MPILHNNMSPGGPYDVPARFIIHRNCNGPCIFQSSRREDLKLLWGPELISTNQLGLILQLSFLAVVEKNAL